MIISNSEVYRTLVYQNNISPGSTNSLVAFYSLRQLDGYTGNCIEVQRSSDLVKQEIGFSSGYLDTTALSAFVGVGDGHITKWFNQTEGTATLEADPRFGFTYSTSRPLIVASGSIKMGSLAFNSINFDGYLNRLRELTVPTFDFTQNGRFTVFSVFEPQNLGGVQVFVHADSPPTGTYRCAQIGRINSSNRNEFLSFNTSGTNFTDAAPTTLVNNTAYLSTSVRRQTQIETYTNGNTNGATTTTGTPRRSSTGVTPNFNYLTVGTRFATLIGGDQPFDGNIYEVAIYNYDMDNTERSNKETEIQTYYGI